MISPNLIIVAAGTLIMALTSSLAGTFVFLRKESLLGDVLSHAVFPGVCISFLISGQKNNLSMFIGASITGIIAIALIQYLGKQPKIKQDAALAYVLSTFFALGIIILSFMQNLGISGQSGLETFLFGSAASILLSDFWFFIPAFFIVIALFTIFYKELKLVSFDRKFALISAIPTRITDLVIGTMALLAIITGIQAMGVVLMAALMIIPPTIGRTMSGTLKNMLIISSLVAILGSLMGTFLSASIEGAPTGPWIVLVLGFLAAISFIFSPSRGLIAGRMKTLRREMKINSEHILKTIYKSDDAFRASGALGEKRAIRSLLKGGLVKLEDGTYQLTDTGTEEARRLVRLHRLWELYLTKKMGIKPDHVHEDADSVEHIISGDVEELLLETLDHPQRDPHDQEIPYGKES